MRSSIIIEDHAHRWFFHEYNRDEIIVKILWLLYVIVWNVICDVTNAIFLLLLKCITLLYYIDITSNIVIKEEERDAWGGPCPG
jgi:hypothetical protein